MGFGSKEEKNKCEIMLYDKSRGRCNEDIELFWNG